MRQRKEQMHKVTKQMQLLKRHTVKCNTGSKEEGGFDFPKKSMRRKKLMLVSSHARANPHP